MGIDGPDELRQALIPGLAEKACPACGWRPGEADPPGTLERHLAGLDSSARICPRQGGSA